MLIIKLSFDIIFIFGWKTAKIVILQQKGSI